MKRDTVVDDSFWQRESGYRSPLECAWEIVGSQFSDAEMLSNLEPGHAEFEVLNDNVLVIQQTGSSL